MIDIKKARQAYKAQVKHCKARVDRAGQQIEMKMTFEEWLKVWLDSGKWELRGKHKDCYCMARHNDLGHYEVGNVSIKTTSENAAEASIHKVFSQETIAAIIANNKKRNSAAVMHEANRGRPLSEEHRRKIGLLKKGSISPFKGRTHTPEAVELMRQAHIGKSVDDETRQKLHDAHAGRKWYNDGIRCYKYFEDDPRVAGLNVGRLSFSKVSRPQITI